MIKIIPVLLIVFLLISCAGTKLDNAELENKAFSFQSDDEVAVIYLVRDFDTKKPTTLRFHMMQIVDPETRNKLDDALNTLVGDSTEGAGIPFKDVVIKEKSFARIEMPAGEYNTFSYFYWASNLEILQSRQTHTFKQGEVYFFKIDPRPDGSYNSTIYFLQEIPLEQARNSIEINHLKPIATDCIKKEETRKGLCF